MSKRRDRRYWRSLEERETAPGPDAPEFAEAPPEGERRFTIGRRGFLAAAGFTAALAGCGPGAGRKALGHITAPEGSTPGRILHYASTCQACPASCGLLARSRDGRPIKLEGNPVHALSAGGLCAAGQASILGLYDRRRFQQPLAGGAKADWARVDTEILARLGEIRAKGGAVRVLTRTQTSPTLRRAIRGFLATFADGRLVTYDPVSSSAISDAHRRTHGLRALPHYRFDAAEVIVSIDADFLGTWISPVEFTRAYARGRTLEGQPPRCSWHVQIEPRLTTTGAKADLRVACAPWESAQVTAQLAQRVARLAGVAWGAAAATGIAASTLDEIARRLWEARGKSLVVSGLQDPDAQAAVNLLNHLLGNYGKTLDLGHPSLQAQGSDADLEVLLREMGEGRVAALFVLDGNPAFELPVDWAALVKRVPLTVGCAERPDETTATLGYVCPRPHYLAAWGDAEAVAGRYSLAQPLFPVLGTARPILESVAAWTGAPATALALVQDYWRAELHPRAGGDFRAFWDRALHDGYIELPGPAEKAGEIDVAKILPPAAAVAPAAGSYAIVLYPKTGLLDGRHAWNPWLQELPDPITKAAWDNYACVAPAAARELGLADGDLVRLEGEGLAIELPVLIQPGLQERTIAVALGYGSLLSERFSAVGPKWLEGQPTVGDDGRVGRNAAPLLRFQDNLLRGDRRALKVVRVGGRRPLARSQIYHSSSVPKGLAPAGHEKRGMIQESSVAAFAAGKPAPAAAREDLWPEDHKISGPRWGMAIDLSACTGCSACVVSCQVENNVPVVGRDEVRRQRDLQWIRIDRYYADDPAAEGNVDVAFQPMMCHHCGNAPCETVCPVLATVRSADGLNQQVYNRCVGTRYCANNCPYKVRRFNWFDYPRGDGLENLVLNPGVTVRSRGVMEKCSLCVQRIHEAKAEARRRGVPLADGDAQTACQQSCPAGAIVFGDLNDPQSAVSKKIASGRAYQVLSELNVKPAIHYQEIVRNRPEGREAAHE